MNKQVIRTVPVALLLINAVVIALTNMDLTQIIFSAIVLGLLCIFVYTRSWESFTQKLYWLGLGALLMGILIPALPFPMSQFENGFERFFSHIFSSNQSAIQILCLVVLLGSQFFLKRIRFNPVLVLIRFAALYVLLTLWTQDAMLSMDAYQPLVLVSVSLAAATELCSSLNKTPRPATLRCFLFILACIFLTCMVGPAAFYAIGDLFENWLLTSLIVLGVAGLILAENYIQYKTHTDLFKHNCLSWALIAWVLLYTLMQLIPDLFNPIILYFAFPMAYCLCSLYAAHTKGFTWPIRFAISGGCLFLCLLVLARADISPLVKYAVLLVLVGVIICLSIMQKKAFAPALTNTLLGIANVLLVIACHLHKTPSGEIPKVLIFAIVLGVMWALLCNQIEKLHGNASSIHRNEFIHLRKVGQIIPLVGLGITFIHMLFFL